ncbi:glycosyltransferase family 92 protein [Chromohalobacter canadensis]|uniref:Glycosyltransferase family 92 protein n=1 Tax=Chromohalobacter canadensis TaxID=141389 RepID=A0ABZ0YA39_9GAMM|nr:glycosyltransferase family 92 protein [Chromohalobacter canadensis]MCK0770260.1 glycosyltransferase family 92 protein [Chromohalobacter canadensis]WQH08937.1 glycosyltransferase family 92 protein [Chromohalobacter canadensis]
MSKEINPVFIPGDMDLKRHPNTRDTFAPGELINFDHKTIFYDVYIDEQDASLVAIGPPCLNLKDYIKKAKLIVNGVQTPFSLKEHEEHKICFLKARISSGKDYEIEFKFKDFSTTLKLKSLNIPHGNKVLAAISKNNKTEWISDWVDFYRENYDLDGVYIYDNGSKNVDELEHKLEGRAKVIRWNHPYGPPKKRFNKFAQPGALNHCLNRFAKKGVLFNFDIDELLIANQSDIDSELEKNGTVYFDSYNVPFVNPGKDDYSYYDFSYREKNRRKSARKFVCLHNAVDIISQHNTWTFKNIFIKQKVKRNKPDKLESKNGFFMHFLGITTNWQPGLKKLKETPLDSLEPDKSHIKMRYNKSMKEGE